MTIFTAEKLDNLVNQHQIQNLNVTKRTILTEQDIVALCDA